MAEAAELMANDLIDVVIVGSGPVGLLKAIGLLQLNPELKVRIVEKRESYSRNHVLNLQHKQLQKFMAACDAAEDEELTELLADLKANPHIRTNALQQRLCDKAKQLGAEVVIEELKPTPVFEDADEDSEDSEDSSPLASEPEGIQAQIYGQYPNLKLLIGADGTHSVVSDEVFGAKNKRKYKFDYVLQIRFEVQGDEKAIATAPADLFALMVRHNFLANEYVGKHKDGRTPITTQIMISEADFIKLKSIATSKNPIQPFVETDPHKDEIPDEIIDFIRHYIILRVRECMPDGHDQVLGDLRVSVNEAPATQALKVFKTDGTPCPVILAGDASLGLSYFKGLNAGFESTAKWLELNQAWIQRGLEQQGHALAEYQDWFLDDFAPRKVKEVGKYSKRVIRSGMKAISASHYSKASMLKSAKDQFADSLLMYQEHMRLRPEQKFEKFPHRQRYWERASAFTATPLWVSGKRIKQLFSHTGKAYKSKYHVGYDLMQPVRGIYHILAGVFKLVTAILLLPLSFLISIVHPKAGEHYGKRLLHNLQRTVARFFDGLMHVVRGGLEVALTPFTWTIRLLTRGIITKVRPTTIETNPGVKNLLRIGPNMLGALNVKKPLMVEESVDDASISEAPAAEKIHGEMMYKLKAIVADLHRKYRKEAKHKQKTTIKPDAEAAAFATATRVEATKADLQAYLELFKFAASNHVFVQYRAADKRKQAAHVAGLVGSLAFGGALSYCISQSFFGVLPVPSYLTTPVPLVAFGIGAACFALCLIRAIGKVYSHRKKNRRSNGSAAGHQYSAPGRFEPGLAPSLVATTDFLPYNAAQSMDRSETLAPSDAGVNFKPATVSTALQ